MSAAVATSKKARRKTPRVDKTSREFQDSLWRKWPTAADWPGSLDLYEAAAYLRVSYGTVWRACQTGKDNKAELAHRRLGDVYRIAKATLDRFGAVADRSERAVA